MACRTKGPVSTSKSKVTISSLSGIIGRKRALKQYLEIIIPQFRRVKDWIIQPQTTHIQKLWTLFASIGVVNIIEL